MTTYWVLKLRSGAMMGPWLGSKKLARQAALRAGGWKRLPKGAKIVEAPRSYLLTLVARGMLR